MCIRHPVRILYLMHLLRTRAPLSPPQGSSNSILHVYILTYVYTFEFPLMCTMMCPYFYDSTCVCFFLIFYLFSIVKIVNVLSSICGFSCFCFQCTKDVNIKTITGICIHLSSLQSNFRVSWYHQYDTQ